MHYNGLQEVGPMAPEQKVLVVSEDPDRAQRILTILQKHHYAARCAGCGGEALKLYEAWPAELIISDYQLRGLQEMQLVELIRTMNQRARFILIITLGCNVDFHQITPNRVVAYLNEGFVEEELIQNVDYGFGVADGFYNRRRFSRHQLAMDTHCILINPFTNNESRPIAGLIRDVSRSGASMLVRQMLPVPAMLKLVVEIPQTRKSITMLAKSLSCTLTQIPNVYRLGAKFVGLLPAEMEQAITAWNADHVSPSESDIFMGKSFKKAVEEWLVNHQDSLVDNLLDHDTPLPRLVDEVCTSPTDSDSH
jgi:CheY-like chemotaxis protein